MKKYVKPLMNSEVFIANEYVGACWEFKCECYDDNEELLVIEAATKEQAIHNSGLKNYGTKSGLDYYVMTGSLYGNNKLKQADCRHEGLSVDWNCGAWPSEVRWICRGLQFLDSIFTDQTHHHVTVSVYDKRPNHS